MFINFNQFQIFKNIKILMNLRSKRTNQLNILEKNKIYVASGNTKTSKGNISINAQKITAFMDKTNNSDMTHIEANGNVIIINSDTITKSEYAKYSLKTNSLF